MSWTDEEIDKLFKDKAESMSFEYKPEYWDQFNTAIPFAETEAASTLVTDNEIDGVYRDSVKDLSFKYKDEYWHEMASMLPERRQPDFLWFATAVLFLGLLTTSVFVGQLRRNELSTANVVAQEGSSMDTQALTPSNGNVTTQEVLNVESTNELPLTGSESSVANEIPVQRTVLQSPNKQLQNESHLLGNESGANESLNPRSPESSLTVGTNVTEDGTNPLPGINEVPAIIDYSVNNENPMMSNPESDQSRNELSENSNEDHTIDNIATRALENTVITNSIANLEDQVRFPDFKLPHASSFYVELNGGLSQSLITPSEKLSYSVGVGLGGQFQKGRFTFTTGVNGIWAFHDDILLNRKAKVYGFGSNVYNYTVKYNHIYSLEAVLSAGYTFGRHRITVGVRPSFAFSSKVGFTLQGEDVDSERKVVYGHMDGINRFGLKPMIGYSVELPSNLTIGLNIGTQVMTSVNEDFIDGKNNRLPIDGQLYIRKRLRFRK